MITFFDDLSNWIRNADNQEFNHVFGNEIGGHIWWKYATYDFDFFMLWQYLGCKERKLLTRYLETEMGDM